VMKQCYYCFKATCQVFMVVDYDATKAAGQGWCMMKQGHYYYFKATCQGGSVLDYEATKAVNKVLVCDETRPLLL
jgi:hypothetical protein